MFDLLNAAAVWGLGTALAGGLLLLITTLAVRRVSHPHLRQRLGEWGVLAALLVAVLRLGPSWLPLPWSLPSARADEPRRSEPQEVAIALTPMPHYEDFAVSAPPYPPAELIVTDDASQPFDGRWIVAGLTGLYLIAAGGFLARWALGQWALGRLLKRSRPASERLRRLFAESAGNLKPMPRLLVSPRVAVPVCCGLFRPTVVLPEVLARSADDTALRWVFAHELTHLKRYDPWSCWGFALAEAVYFYLPWFWWLRRQVRLCQEYVADAAAAAEGQWADEYAQFLVSLARCPATPLGATGVIGNRSDLFRRVNMLLKPSERPSGPLNGRWSLLAATGLVGAAVLLSGVGPRAEGALTPRGDEGMSAFFRNEDEDDAKVGKKGDSKVIVIDVDTKPAKKGDAEVQKNVIVIDGKSTKIVPKVEFNAQAVTVDLDPAKLGIDDEEVHKKIAEAVKKLGIDDEEVRKKLEEAVKKAQQKAAKANAAAELNAQATRNMATNVATRFYRVHSDGGRLGARVDQPSATLADQLDLPKGQGLVLSDVIADSVAAKSGLKANDILLEFDGKAVPSDPGRFVKQVQEIKADERVTAVVLRKGRKETIKGIKLPDVKTTATISADGQFLKFAVPAADGNVIWRVEPLQGALDPTAPLREVHPMPPVPPLPPAAPVPPVPPSAKKGQPLPVAKHVSNTSSNVSIMIQDGQFTAKQAEGSLTIIVTGKVNDGKVEVSGVSIEEPGASGKYSGIDKVPEQYRARVKKLISNGEGSPLQFDFRKKEVKDKDD